MKKFFVSITLALALLLITTLAQTTLNGSSGQLNEKVDKLFAQWDKPDSPGCSIGVIKDGKLVYKRGYGSANLDYNAPLTSESVFYIASTSKQFTAASILLLIRRGKISLDDDIHKYFPELPRYEATITVNHLVHHTSGVRDYLELMGMAGRKMDEPFNNQEAVELIARQKGINFKPGEKFSYSNSNYVLIAEIVRRVSGKSLREFADENIFRPLGMTNTLFNDDRTAVVKNRVVSYAQSSPGRYTQFVKTIEAMGDGNLLTTVEDLAKWDQNFYDNKIGGEGFSQQMLTRTKLNNGEEIPYGFGLGNEEYKGLKAVAHGGGFMGFRTEMIRFPEQRFTVICLCNVGAANPGALARQVADLYLADRIKPAENKSNNGKASAMVRDF
jgi:CubicO group peptidase (beta-lactamase class C family)